MPARDAQPVNLRIAILVSALLFGASRPALGITIRHDKDDADYVALSTDPKWAAAGVYTSTSTCAGSGGTLIHPEWVITAGHCLNSSAAFRLGATRGNPDVSVDVSSTTRHPMYSSGNIANGKDLGLSNLSAPILSVTPMRLYRFAGEIGQEITVVGYGRTGTGLSGQTGSGLGIRRAGTNRVDAFGGIIGASSQVLITDFDNPNNPSDSFSGPSTPLEYEHGIALYDSGSGWFADIGGTTYLLGVTSFRTNTDGSDNSDYGDIFGATRVSREITWINSAHDQTMFWNPNQTGDWGTAGLWETSTEPGAANAAVIDGGHAMITEMDEIAKYTFLVGDGELTLSNMLATNNFILRESGTLSVDVDMGPGVIDGEYSQSAGTLAIDIGGTTVGAYDQLEISGSAELGGSLEVTPNAGFGSSATRGQSDTFTVLTAGSIQSEFDEELYNGQPLSETMAYVGEAGDGRDGVFASISYGASSVEVHSYFALEGDANGDGNVDGSDFVIWNDNKFTSGTDWSTGDFNNDGLTDGQDFVLWNNNKFTSVPDLLRVPAVPEPTFMFWALLPVAALLRGRTVIR